MLTQKQIEIINLLKAVLPTAPAKVAQDNVDWYKQWVAGESLAVGDRRAYNKVLYEVIQAHTTQESWTPDLTPTMWAVINVEHTGALDDPIPAARNMEYTKGLYYVEGDAIYLMNREGMEDGEKIMLAYLPSELIGQYFKPIELSQS